MPPKLSTRINDIVAINFNTPNMTLVYFPPGAGGKFLINSLGLSPDCVLQHSDLAIRQMQGDLCPADKLHLLLDRIQHSAQWSDLGLGCEQLFGSRAVYTHNTGGYCVNFRDIPESFCWSEITHDLSHRHLRFFLVAHGYPMLQNHLEIWPRARVILITNSDNFRRRLRPERFFGEIWNFWQDVRGQDWPSEPPLTRQDYDRLPQDLREEIRHTHADGLIPLLLDQDLLDRIKHREQQISNEITNAHDVFLWDADWFFDRHKTLQQLSICYEWLGITGYDDDLLGTLHQHWLSKLWQIAARP